MKQPKAERDFDVIIIGGGAAGISTALWCDELQLKAVVLEQQSQLGGQLHTVHNAIENHLGVFAENGRALNEIFLEQVKKRKFETRFNVKIEKVDLQNKKVFLSSGKTLSASAIVIATGVSRRKLEISGEKEFGDKGILTSGKRDAHLVQNKTVCIIGGGDAALENALILSETAKKVYVIHRRAEFSARPEFTEAAKNLKNVEFLMQTTLKQIGGREKIEFIEISTEEESSKTLQTDGVLIRIGVSPNTELFRNQLKCDESGYIEIDSNCETNLPLVYAVGDVSNPLSPTISTAVGNGANVGKILFHKMNIAQ